MSTPVTWRPSPQGRALLAVAGVALVSALATRHPALLALAAPAVWTLLTTRTTGEPVDVDVVTSRRQVTGDEGHELFVDLTVVLPEAVAAVRADLALPSTFEGDLRGDSVHAKRLRLEGVVVPGRWGRHVLGPVTVDLLSAGGLRAGRAVVHLQTAARVLPQGTRVGSASAPSHLPNRLGEHTTRVGGHGVEPLAVRAFAAGDSVRRINWRVSSRRQQLHVTVAASERAVDLVLVLDALSDVPTSNGSSLDQAVRAATGVADRWLRERDRVGVVVLGGKVRWLRPTSGRSQLRQIAEVAVWSWVPPSDIVPDVRQVPRATVPSGSVVLFFTPLLEMPSLDAVAVLRERSSRVLVVDVSGDAAPPVGKGDRTGELARRLWRLDRDATAHRLRALGTPVLQPGDGDLDRLIALALRSVR